MVEYPAAKGDASHTCIVSPEALGPFTNGGVGTAAYRLASLLSRNGNPVTLLYTGEVMAQVRDDWRHHYYVSHGIELVVLDQWRGGREDPGAPLDHRPYRTIDALRAERVCAFLIENPFDLVYFQDFRGHGLRAVQYKRAGCGLQATRLLVWCHSSYLWSLSGNRRLIQHVGDLIREAHERLAAQGADAVATPSDYMNEVVAREWSIASPEHLPLWHSPEGAPATRDRVTYRGFRHLVFFGRLERRKGLDLLLGALCASTMLHDRLERVTFLGRQITIDGMASGTYIERALAGLGLNWDIVDGLNTDEALAWLAQQTEVLLVLPSVLDNFPFAVLEVFLGRLPFVASRVGGIPEIVGSDNAGLLFTPTVVALRECLERVFGEQRLQVEYRAGYRAEVAEARVLQFHAQQLALGRDRGPATVTAAIEVVLLCDTADRTSLQRSLSALGELSRFSGVHVVAGAALSFAGRRALTRSLTGFPGSLRLTDPDALRLFNDAGEPAADLLLLYTGECIDAAGIDALQRALHRGGDDLVSGYVARNSASGDGSMPVQRPLGAAIELGCMANTVASTPCLVAARMRERLVACLSTHSGDLYPALLELAAGGARIGVVPQLIAQGGLMPDVTRDDNTRFRIAGIVHAHRQRLRVQLLYPLLFPDAGKGLANAYRALAKIDDQVLEDHLSQAARDDAISLINERLTPLLHEWRRNPPCLFVYGAGEHSKVLFALCPALWQWTHGFIDGQGTGVFLGKPRYAPDDVVLPADATLLYSSREHEQAMYARMRHHAVRHVLLYPTVASTTGHGERAR